MPIRGHTFDRQDCRGHKKRPAQSQYTHQRSPGPGGTAALLLQLQRTMGNQAVNQLLRQQALQRAEETADPSNHIAAALWNTSVVSPMQKARKASKHGPHHAHRVFNLLAGTEPHMGTVADTLSETKPYQSERITILHTNVTAVLSQLDPYVGNVAGPGGLDDGLGLTLDGADSVTEDLEAPTGTPQASGTGGAQPAAALWKLSVVKPLQEARKALKAKPKDVQSVLDNMVALYAPIRASAEAARERNPLLAAKMERIYADVSVLVAMLMTLDGEKSRFSSIVGGVGVCLAGARQIGRMFSIPE